MQDMEKEIQELRQSKMNSIGKNILNKYTHLSLSQIEESENEIST